MKKFCNYLDGSGHCDLSRYGEYCVEGPCMFENIQSFISTGEVRTYLQKCLDEWFGLGERRFEPANMWGYNFIMKCFDDLQLYETRGKTE